LRAIFGIGNPGNRYDKTRHNIGFIILERFAEKHNLLFTSSKYDFYSTRGELENCPFFLIKPTTYVNRCGLAASDFFDENNIEILNFLVVSDDLNLPEGKIRLRKSGGDGGHNGMNSIIYHLESDQFPRLRFGIGNQFNDGEMANYVLNKLDDEKLASLKPDIDFAVLLLEQFVLGGYQKMLDYYSKNVKNKEEDK